MATKTKTAEQLIDLRKTANTLHDIVIKVSEATEDLERLNDLTPDERVGREAVVRTALAKIIETAQQLKKDWR